MSSRRRGIALVLVALLVAVLVVARRGDGGARDPRQGATGAARVVRTDLVSRRVLKGRLGYLDVDGGLVAGSAGQVTDLRPEGEVVAPGHALYRLGGEPVLLLTGDVAVTRDLVLGTRGPDVAELNATFGVGGDVFTLSTVAALRQAQEAAGGTPTGVVRPAQAVVLGGPARVGAHAVVDGTVVQAGDPVAGLALDELVVEVDLDAAERDAIAAGDEVEVELPSGDDVAATVRSVASVASAAKGAEQGDEQGDDEDQVVEVVITFVEPDAAHGLTGAAVDVSVTDATAEGVLAVPVTALVALAEGGYGVEVVAATGHRLVGVDVGMFSDADDLVEVTGALHEGDRVAVPR
jgi:hypothetical protein